jgi:hypothetical protein
MVVSGLNFNQSLPQLKVTNFNKILDITPKNILHGITGLDGVDEDEVLSILGSPVINPILDTSGELSESVLRFRTLLKISEFLDRIALQS